MIKHLFFILFLLLCSGFLTAQDGMIGTGFANGWNYPADVIAMQPSFGGSYIYTTNANATGDSFFRFTRSTDGNQFGPFDCNDFEWTNQDGISYNDMGICNVTGAFFIDAPNTTDNYVFKTRFQDNDDFLFFRIQGNVFDFLPGQTAQDPMKDGFDRVASDTPVTVTTIANPRTGQALYLRYSTDGFATSIVIQMTDLFGISLYDAIIPGQPDGTTVTYYLFSSGDGTNGPMADGSDADYKTINAETNGGSNFFYITDGALPVEYQAFNGRRQIDGVQLNWATSTEQDADFFEVQRSADGGRSWQVCDQVPALNSRQGGQYDYLDGNAPRVALQYRLRQVDIDGKAAVSRIIPIEASFSVAEFSVFPQPANDQVTVQTQLTNYSDAKLEITDLNGRVLHHLPLTNERQTISIGNLPRGVYLLRVWELGRGFIQRRIVKQ